MINIEEIKDDVVLVAILLAVVVGVPMFGFYIIFSTTVDCPYLNDTSDPFRRFCVIPSETRLQNIQKDKLTINLSCPEPVCYPPDCDEVCPDCLCIEQTVPLFVKEARAVSESHSWNEDGYMCCSFSTELWKRLTADGYKAEICYGEYTPLGERHCWVELGGIIIEATTGEFVLPKDNVRYLKEQCDDRITPQMKSWVTSYSEGWYD